MTNIDRIQCVIHTWRPFKYLQNFTAIMPIC